VFCEYDALSNHNGLFQLVTPHSCFNHDFLTDPHVRESKKDVHLSVKRQTLLQPFDRFHIPGIINKTGNRDNEQMKSC
jgi:hypothetical protein